MTRRVTAKQAQAAYIASTMKPAKTQPTHEVKVETLIGEVKWIKVVADSVEDAKTQAEAKKNVMVVFGVHKFGDATVWFEQL